MNTRPWELAVVWISSDVNCALEAEGHIRAVQVIVDGLGECHDIETFLAQKVRGLGGSVAAAHDQAVQLQLVVGLLHGLDFVDAVLIGLTDGLERNTARSQDCAAPCEDALEVLSCEDAEFSVDQALVAVLKSVEFHGLLGVVHDALEDAAHGRVECLAVTAACQKTDSQHLFLLLILDVNILLHRIPFSGRFTDLVC